MTRNLGNFDKAVRFFLCTLCVYYGFTLEPRSGINGFLILAAFYLFVSALGGYCVLYKVFQWSTRDKRQDSEAPEA